MMPRPGPRRPLVNLRLSVEGLAYIDALAKAEGVNRSEMIRRLLTEAVTARQAVEPTVVRRRHPNAWRMSAEGAADG